MRCVNLQGTVIVYIILKYLFQIQAIKKHFILQLKLINEKVEYMKCLLNYDINYKNPILLGPVYKPLSSRQGKCDLPHFSVPHP